MRLARLLSPFEVPVIGVVVASALALAGGGFWLSASQSVPVSVAAGRATARGILAVVAFSWGFWVGIWVANSLLRLLRFLLRSLTAWGRRLLATANAIDDSSRKEPWPIVDRLVDLFGLGVHASLACFGLWAFVAVAASIGISDRLDLVVAYALTAFVGALMVPLLLDICFLAAAFLWTDWRLRKVRSEGAKMSGTVRSIDNVALRSIDRVVSYTASISPLGRGIGFAKRA